LILLGIVISDRRNALAIERIYQNQQKIERVLRMYAYEKPELAEAMQTARLL
jgi:hypothetical protein